MRILGIETSCDETAAAVVEDGRRVRSSIVSSQVKLHAPYGGVVPELASRAHVELINPVVDEALMEAGILEAGELDAVAACYGPGLAGALLVGAASVRLLRGAGQRTPMSKQAGHAGVALWSFLMATAHGAGLMLVPALVPLCLADNPAREITASGSLVLALAAVGVHTAAMLATTGVIATGVCRGVAMHPRMLSGTAPRQAWTAALAVTGVLLMALR